MSTCAVCGEDMEAVETRCYGQIKLGGVFYDQVDYDGSRGEYCPDCGVTPGGHHHPGCDLERCPRCRRRPIGCGCPTEEEA